MRRIKRVICMLLGVAVMTTGMQAFPLQLQAAEYWPEGIEIESESAIVMEAGTGTVLYEKNADEQHFPASITKIMTALVALKYGNLDDVVTFSDAAVYNTEGSSIARDVGEQMTLEQTMYGMLLESANECAYAVAEHVGGTMEHFVEMMNEEAAALGCTGTHFANPHGLHDDNHYTTARDMALIAKAAWESETFRIMTGTRRYVIPPTNKHDEESYLQNHNNMINDYETTKYLYEYCVGGKTGYTQTANSTLVTYAQKDGMTLICVIMNAQSPAQWTDSINLYNYCFDNFKLYNVAENETRYTNDILNTGSLNTNGAFVELDKEAEVVLPTAAVFEEAAAEVNAVTDSGDIAGNIVYTYAGHTVGSASIIKTGVIADEFEFENVITDEESTEDGVETPKVVQVTPEKIALIALIAVLVLIGIFLCYKLAVNFYLIRQRYYNWKNSRSPYKTIKKKKFKKKRRRK